MREGHSLKQFFHVSPFQILTRWPEGIRAPTAGKELPEQSPSCLAQVSQLSESLAEIKEEFSLPKAFL